MDLLQLKNLILERKYIIINLVCYSYLLNNLYFWFIYNYVYILALTDEDITSQALLFFLAGFETSSTLLCFVSYELALNMDVQQKLQEEIDRTLKECDGKISYETIQKMKYLDMVISGMIQNQLYSSTLYINIYYFRNFAKMAI